MSVRVYLSGDPVHDRVLRAFYDGCPESKVLTDLAHYEASDVAVIFGVGKKHVPVSWPRGEVFQRQKLNKLRSVVLETGYLNRGDGENHHYAAGFDGLNGRADFRNKGMLGDRAHLLRAAHVMHCMRWRNESQDKNWAERGSNIMLCGQVPWDASVDFTDHIEWIYRTALAIREHTDKVIRFRPHPKAPLPKLGEMLAERIPKCYYSDFPFLEDAPDTHAVVTFNSNTAVEAALYGLPVFAADHGSMAWEIANKDLSKLDNPDTPEREQWINDLAYTQWTPEEMRAGLAWRHLFR